MTNSSRVTDRRSLVDIFLVVMLRMISTTTMLELMVSALERIRSGVAKQSHVICVIGGLFVRDKGNMTANC